MTTEPPPTTPPVSALDKLKTLIEKRKLIKLAQRGEMLDNRYEDLEQYAETAEERQVRIMADSTAWNNL